MKITVYHCKKQWAYPLTEWNSSDYGIKWNCEEEKQEVMENTSRHIHKRRDTFLLIFCLWVVCLVGCTKCREREMKFNFDCVATAAVKHNNEVTIFNHKFILPNYIIFSVSWYVVYIYGCIACYLQPNWHVSINIKPSCD